MATNSSLINAKDAFAKVSTEQLEKEIAIFKRLNNPLLNNDAIKGIMKFMLEKGIPPFEYAIRRVAFEHFCGGVSIEDCEGTINLLARNNVSTILDYSKESGDESTFDLTVSELLKTILHSKKNKDISFAVFKLSGIGDKKILENISRKKESVYDKLKFEKIKERVDKLCKAAYENNLKILIDAEHSWIQDAIDLVAEEMMLKYNAKNFIVYNTVQLYRKDRLNYLTYLHRKLSAKGIKTAVKIVRGAYMEEENNRATKNNYPSPIHSTKNDTDSDYQNAIKYCIENIENIAICAGTHNEESTESLVKMMKLNALPENDHRVHFAQLLGMANHLSFALGASGYNVAKYVPYGKVKEVMPYLMRRSEENKSVEGEMPRELFLRQAELRRRTFLNTQ